MNIINPVRHGLIMALLALITGALWAAYMATHHEQLHGAFEAQEKQMLSEPAQQLTNDMDMDMGAMQLGNGDGHPHDHAAHATGHSHSGSLAQDAMQRLLRGHIHFMGIGVLAAVLLLITALTSLKSRWKSVLGWSFGLGALAYPPAWIVMGFRTVEMGPQAAEASIMWLFASAVGLLLASMIALLVILLIESFRLQQMPLLRLFFNAPERL
ncbi:MAG: hypothetical protein AUJ57_02860 [Zetaproteobacteria bacterium CG1_02_53_45]|nr:MAG: hypothetical protein AUJ57_02860 [Zetaproteobacteria bacterium CG1_02_53_45]